MSRYYILQGHEAVAVSMDMEKAHGLPDYLQWAQWFEDSTKDGSRVVACDYVGDIRVSTVFLGLDHRWGPGPPLIFETMIFGGRMDQTQSRTSTWEEAEFDHARHLAAVRLAERRRVP